MIGPGPWPYLGTNLIWLFHFIYLLICHRVRKMCSLTETGTLDPQNTEPWLYRLSYLAAYTLSPLNCEQFWTVAYSLALLKFVLKFLMGTENNVKLDWGLIATLSPVGRKMSQWEKCPAWQELEPGTLRIPYHGSTDLAIRPLTHFLP
jgi:hypothetical protein